MSDFTAVDFVLYDLGEYPGVIGYKGKKVKGELYAIDINTLKRLDVLEEEGDLYIRKLVKVVNCNNEIQEAYIYVYNEDTSKNIKASLENQPWRG
ncbi:gamma-glutamylcyclotransferase family protein [Clostridium magnum]|uniref:gamma-glutamylcyclotransferase family protein n=1 Tax=Clostridium magnum TaxID=33954 RepID=UPI0009ED7BEC|nr:gamma-glutamylcyclotransferase family protein [Clostridium magnum]